MSEKLILVLGLVFFFFGGNLARAEIVISEVKISPIEDRFIKLYNQDNSTVDLTNWYIQRKTQNGTKFDSLVTSTYFKDKKIDAKDYFLISRRLTENSNIVLDGLTLTESNVIQLKNMSGEVIDKVCWGDINDCGDVNIPNPATGESIIFSNQISSNLPSTPVAESVQTITDTKTKITEIPKIKIQISAKTFGFVNMPLYLDATTFGLNGEQLRYGKYFWNFGDGDSKEIQLSNNTKFFYTYFYPGDYSVSLDYYSNYSDIPDASAQINIKIIGADISISRVGDEKDFFIELSNNTDYNADLSNWFLTSDTKSFMIPRNTILGQKKKIIISPKITNFSIFDKDSLKLITPERETVFAFARTVLAKTVLAKINSNRSEFGRPTSVEDKIAPVIEVSNLEASTIESNATEKGNSNSYIPIFASIIFIGSSAGAVYFIRQKKVISEDANDFEILDE